MKPNRPECVLFFHLFVYGRENGILAVYEGVNGFDGGRRRGCLQILSEVGSIPTTSIKTHSEISLSWIAKRDKIINGCFAK